MKYQSCFSGQIFHWGKYALVKYYYQKNQKEYFAPVQKIGAFYSEYKHTLFHIFSPTISFCSLENSM